MKQNFTNNNSNLDSQEETCFYGIHVVQNLLDTTGILEHDVLLIASNSQNPRILRIKQKFKKSEEEIRLLTYQEMSNVVDTEKHQGVALLRENGVSWSFLKKEEIFENKGFRLFVAIDSLNDPQNLGSIIRSSVGLGLSGIILPKKRVPMLNSTVSKCSAGTLSLAKICKVSGISSFLQEAKRNGIFIVGTSLSGEKISLGATSYIQKQQSVILVLGSEDKGMSRLSEEQCDLLLKISLMNNVDSLNVANAASIFFYTLSDLNM